MAAIQSSDLNAASGTQAQVNALLSEIQTLRMKMQRTTQVTAIAAGVMLALFCCYCYWGFKMWAEVTQPDALVGLADKQIEENLPELRKSVEEQIIKGAPAWAKDMSKQAVEYVPEGRKKLEQYAEEQLDAGVDQARLLTKTEFKKFLAKNRPLMEKHIKNLAQHSKLAEASLQELMLALEKDQQINLRGEIRDLTKTLREANEYWKYLLAGKDLGEGPRLERRVWMLARRLQMELADSDRAQASATIKTLKSAP